MKKSVLPPPAIGVISLIIPGLGHIIAGFWRRGLLVFLSVISMVGILQWRVAELGRRAGTGWPVIVRAFERRTFFVTVVVLCILIVWLLAARDAWICAKERRKRFSGLFLFVLLGFFLQGWQIAEIDPVRLIKEAPEALPPLSRVMWPWKAAITYDEDNLVAKAIVLDGEGAAPEQPPEVEGEPYLRSDPNVGRMSTRDEDNNLVAGTRITLTGKNFAPNTITEIWWEDPLGNEYRPGKPASICSPPLMKTESSHWK